VQLDSGRLRHLGRWAAHVARLRYESIVPRARACKLAIDDLSSDARCRLAMGAMGEMPDWELPS
jgi:hypothetical protein